MPLPADRAHDAPHQQPDLPQEHQQDSLSRRLTTLPDGHPSSPNDEEGTPRKPTVNLRDLELPLDDRASPADRADSAERQEPEVSETWREQLPELQSLWDRHLERWPDKEKPSADRSADEPGSWRGDSGLYLNAEENLTAEHTLERVRKAEPDLTKAIKTIATETPGATLAGLEHCLKDTERCKEKISAEARLKPERSIDDIGENLPDIIRYTYQFETDRYYEGCSKVADQLRSHGYDLYDVRDSWRDSQYKGINTRWRDSSGQPFEVQLHTDESFSAKQLTHVAYERLRDPSTSDQEREELREFQHRVSESISIPHGSLQISDYPRKDSSGG
jgi:hypothetical protein